MDRTVWVKRSDLQLHAVQQLLCTPYTSSLSSRSCAQSMHWELVVLHSVQICVFSHQCDPLHSRMFFVSPLLVSYVQLFSLCKRERERELHSCCINPIPNICTILLFQAVETSSLFFIFVQTRMQLNRKFVGKRRRSRPQSA